MKKRYTEEQIIGFLREADAGVSLNEHWFLNLTHAQALIESWRREYNEERPKKALGGLNPVQYARQLANKSATVPTGL